jgi:hypothetical protein
MQEMNENMEEQIRRFAPPDSDAPERLVPKNNLDHLLFISDEEQVFGFANLLHHQKITIYIATGDRNFVTSDNALIEIFPKDRADAF